MADRNTEASRHRVVISGIAGRFPNCSNVTEFQNNLLNKVDCTTTEHGRWDFGDSTNIPQRIGKCDNISKFDRVFFGVHNSLTSVMDPVSRLLLEHSFEAIMDAGINPRSLKGKNVAVIIATNLSESEKSIFLQKSKQSGFRIMGGSKAMIPNRISFFLGLTGPSMNIDSGCAGGGSALEWACNAIKNGMCDAAVVGGAIVSLQPNLSYQLRSLGILSPDGKTRSFDANAEGSARSDGIAVVYLQKAEDAKRIYGEVLTARSIHTECHSVNTVMFPKPEPQIRVMQELLNECRLTPDDISFVEATGLGIRDIDVDELEALDAVYGKRKKPLLIGSVRSNVGDAIPVNTINSLIKMIVASETGQIPPNLHYEKPNPKSAGLKEGRIKVNTELTPWSGQYSMINTIAECGVFSNVILKAYDKVKKNNGRPDDSLPRLVIVSGRTDEAVSTLLNFVETKPVDVEYLQMLYDIFQSEINAYLFRGYTILPAEGVLPIESRKREIIFMSGEKREVWWIFSGMGSQWVGMGEALLNLPVFEAAIRKCDAVLKPKGYDIFKIITDKNPHIFDDIINSFVGIAAIQIGLVDVLRSVGLEPDFIIGHSVGELGCAYADGCFTAEQMILAALSRGLASTETKLERGSMAAVGVGYDEIKKLCPPDIDVACHNGPDSSTISGPATSMKAFVSSLTEKGIFAKEVPCSNIAYHSRYIAPAGPKLLERLQKVIPKANPRSTKWISSSVPQREWNTLKARLCSAEYHTNNLLSPVLFEESSSQIPPNAICIEIAPHGLLQAILKRSLHPSCINIPLTRRGHSNNVEVLLTALGKMYLAGLQPQVANLYPTIEYPVSRGTPSIAPLIKWDHTADWSVVYYTPTEEVIDGYKKIDIDLNDEVNKYLYGYVVNGVLSVPLSLCLVNVWEISKGFDTEETAGAVFENIKVHKHLLSVSEDNKVQLTMTVFKGTGKFEVIMSDDVIVSGIIQTSNLPSQYKLGTNMSMHDLNDPYDLNKDDFYAELEMRGFQYRNDLKNVLNTTIDGAYGLIQWNCNWVAFIDNALQLYTFGNDTRRVEMPFIIQKIVIDQEEQDSLAKNSIDLKAFVDKELNYLQVGGLELQGIKFTALPQTLEQSRFSGDTTRILPNEDKLNLSISTSLRLILQLIMENNFSDKKQKIQLISNDNIKEIEMINFIMHDVPEVSVFKLESISYKQATFNKSLNIMLGDLKEYDFNETSHKLGNNKFLLVFIPNDTVDSYVKLAESLELVVVFSRGAGDKKLVLFRKKSPITNLQILNMSATTKETINNIMKTDVSSEDKRLVIVIKPKDAVNILEFVKQLEKNVNLEHIRVLSIQDTNAPDFSVTESLYKKQLEKDLLMNILIPTNVWSTLRHVNVTVKPRVCRNWKANKINALNPFNVTWTESSVIENTENTVKVEYAAFNQQDVSICTDSFYNDVSEVIGKNRLTQPSIGLEFSGTDMKNNRVMGLACGNSMSNFVNAEWKWAIPKSWSLEDAATVPFSYIIAYSALFVKSEAKAGDSIMITNPCHGFGLAVLNLAVKTKLDIYVTYETEAEQQLIKSSFPSIPNNRVLQLNGERFRDDVLVQTKGDGIDILICHQCKVQQLGTLFTIARRTARVVMISDLKDNQIHESVGMEIFLKEISLYNILPKRILSSDPETKKMLSDMLKDGINNGSVKPLTRTVYSHEELRQAFDSCIANDYFGKVIVKVQPEKTKNKVLAVPRLICYKEKTYVIIEGLTRFGLELIDFLITRGARTFVVASRSNSVDGFTRLRTKIWENYGAKIILYTDFDFSQQENVKSLIKKASSLGSIDGIFNLQQIDTSLKSSTSSVDSTYLITKIMDDESRLSCPDLRLFVVCSMLTNLQNTRPIRTLEDNQGQLKKGVEEIIARRKKDNLHGVFIKWDQINSKDVHENSQIENIVLPPVKKYLQKFDEFVHADESTVQVSYFAAATSEVEEDIRDMIIDSTDPIVKEAKAFTTTLYEKQEQNILEFA